MGSVRRRGVKRELEEENERERKTRWKKGRKGLRGRKRR